ncbi:hypothetical protein [Glutamicibacter sp. NPDC087344]|uniref:hypothetical protein n=1 Tax=Glutamicibacter sp. NPDC087344 TaxID=3363994 RepID=UPI0037F64FED
MIDLIVTWVLGLGLLALVVYPVFGRGSENSSGGEGRHAVAPDGELLPSATTMRQRWANVIGSFDLRDWSVFVAGASFLFAALLQTATRLVA